jgi:hypothetical protein
MEPVESKQVDLAPGESAVPDERVAARGPSFWFDVQVWARDILISIVIGAVVIVFLYQPVKVEGTSMMPWLEDQQRIFVNKFVPPRTTSWAIAASSSVYVTTWSLSQRTPRLTCSSISSR